MSREELALQTQLLLQEASQVAHADAAAALVDGEAPAASELEAAKQSLLDKLRRKKEQRAAQLLALGRQRYGFQSAADGEGDGEAAKPAASAGPQLTPVKGKAFKPPVAACAAPASQKKKDLLQRLRQQAVRQGAENVAKVFGYHSYEEQLKKLNEKERKKLREFERKERGGDEAKGQPQVAEAQLEDEEEAMEVDAAHDGQDEQEEPESTQIPSDVTVAISQSESASTEHVAVAGEDESMAPAAIVTVQEKSSPSRSTSVRRRNRIEVDEDDGNEADSEHDGDDKDEGEEAPAATSGSPVPKKDRAAAYRAMLLAEERENRRRKRLNKSKGGDNFVESEAEEDEEEDALKIGGLGDFGFGVPQAKTQESKEAEEERNALKLHADDLDGIVDDLSDDEQAQQEDIDAIIRMEAEEKDREQVKEVMRNVKEGFGRNRRAFSSGLHAGEARGRFNLDALVAADGDKLEAARLGLLESDEELSEDENGNKKKSEQNGEEGEEEEDEEMAMERALRERVADQPKIYLTSDESESEAEDETTKEATAGADEDEVNSDEEREKQQMKLFSERARINRRMQRMKDLQRQVALENGDDEDQKRRTAIVPNILLEEDEDSQELLKLLNRTDIKNNVGGAAPGSTSASQPDAKRATTSGAPRVRPKLGRFNSFGMTGNSHSSFNRVAGNCKLFNQGSSTGQATKGFVFTSLGGGDQAEAAVNDESDFPSTTSKPDFGKSKSWSHSGRKGNKRGSDATSQGGNAKKPKRTSDFLSVLSSYQAVASNNNSHSAPL